MTLDVTGLELSYDGFDFGPVDLVVDDEILAILGPSGSGKSTLLAAVAGMVTPDAGRVTLDGRSLVGRPIEERGAGVVFQDGALFPHLTARENVGFAVEGTGRVDDLAALLEIESVLDRRPAALSGGERQRVALARTLAADPDFLLLDEPLSSLDAPTRRRLRDELADLFDGLDIPVVYVTHDRRAATALGDRVAVLHDGRVEQVGPPVAVLNRPRTAFVARFTGAENVFEARVVDRTDGAVVLAVGDATLQARVDGAVSSPVTACVRPARVGVTPAGSADCGDGLRGTIRRVLNEGDDRRVTVALDGADLTVVATVRAGTTDGLDRGAPVAVSVPPADVHVIPESGSDRG
ncbi:ABC transporter ATP-binding protein [Haloplanus pelagicus]|jgi:molybdate/tungstate transport system ATP-binding protein|uniref:ABC transporter ATP-binding protein n=1 Tax=Haloplanus pelagicus TaxID=2949995 RepID=UPI00203C0504|nr:ABC transporter ATP-binding protein [Haloplanus sp. HW8-1]